MKRTIRNLNGEMERVNLPKPLYISAATGPENATGIWYTGLWIGPKTGRTFLETYSIWEDSTRPGCCKGSRIKEIEHERFLSICADLGIDVPDFVPAEMV